MLLGVRNRYVRPLFLEGPDKDIAPAAYRAGGPAILAKAIIGVIAMYLQRNMTSRSQERCHRLRIKARPLDRGGVHFANLSTVYPRGQMGKLAFTPDLEGVPVAKFPNRQERLNGCRIGK